MDEHKPDVPRPFSIWEWAIIIALVVVVVIVALVLLGPQIATIQRQPGGNL